MKNFTLALIIIALGFGFINQAQAQRKIEVTEMVKPLAGGNVPSGISTRFEFVVKNTGTETIGASDTIIIVWGVLVGSQVQIQQPIVLLTTPHKVLNVDDTLHYAFNLKINGVGTVSLAFLASYTNLISKFAGKVFQFNVSTGIDENANSISKVWYHNNYINYELVPNTTCKANLFVLNMNGQIIENKALNFVAGNSIHESVSLGTLPSGIYILNIQTENGLDTKKFFVE